MAREKKQRGRPSSYSPQFAKQAYKLCLLGATDKQLADFFEVSEVTLNAWKKKFPEFLKSLTRGKLQADAEVAEALFNRARGYSHKAVKIMSYEGQSFEHRYTEHYPPDSTSCIFWLKNRQPHTWRDRQDVTGGDDKLGEMIDLIRRGPAKTDSGPGSQT